MKCPKCGGEIPFYDLRPNCKHCGVNIYYYSQDYLLARDAKRTELEAASARMIIARLKLSFIGGPLQIVRLILTLIGVAALLLPIGTLHISVPFYDGNFSAGILGIIQGKDTLLPHIGDLLASPLFAQPSKSVVICCALLAVLALLDVLILLFYILSITDPAKRTKTMRNLSLAGLIVAAAAQIAVLIVGGKTPDTALTHFSAGFAAALAAAGYLALFIINSVLLKKGLTPVYRQFDPKRKELLAKVRKGEVDLDDLPLPVFESEEEHDERLRALNEALKAEGEEAVS
ncbi:MAG: hypothetical protein IJU56_01640 [Clostridia bacterium]|nr:hypothetical protein [Clostridia bacterium]